MEEIPGTSVGVLAAEGKLSQEERNEVGAVSTFIPFPPFSSSLLSEKPASHNRVINL
jgi:hypothetical protein